MASNTRAERTRFSSVRRRIGFPGLVLTTLALVSATILLGIATKAAGAGLACDANWPLCDGGLLNMFPATFPSFFEWIHRVVAGITGFFIVGSALAAWRLDTDRAVTWALTLGMILTPVQVLLGRETVRQYEFTILNLHFWTAIAIFSCFTVGAILVWADRFDTTSVPRALGVGALLVPVQVILSPLVIDTYTEVIQTALYAVTLAFLGALFLAAIVGRRRYDGRLASALASVPALGIMVAYFGRESVMGFDPVVVLGYVAVTVVATLVFAALSLVTGRRGDAAATGRPYQ